jgi:Icc-related predicted phosphoesterase
MKLYVTSDLHLEFGDLDLENRDDVDVLVLSGDILVARDIETMNPRGVLSQAFLHRCHNLFPQVVMILGNHEHYHGDFCKSTDIIRAAVADYDNFHVLDKQSVEINDYVFIGGTLWTDFNGNDPLTLTAAGSMMHDFKGVKHSANGAAGGSWRFLPQDALADHEAMLKCITRTIDDRRARGEHSDRVIVVGHHSPSRQSTHARYQNEVLMNGCYSSHLDGFILDRPEICLWTHGHTHEDFDYEIGRTRIVCNPRGYVGYEARADHWQPKLIEV